MPGATDTVLAHPVVRMLVVSGVALVIGALASLAAILFVDVVTALNALLMVDLETRAAFAGSPWLLVAATVLAPTLGGLVVGLALRHLSPARRPLGPPDVIRAVQFREPLPDAKSGIVSSATAALSLGVGASVGEYGPMVYLGALIGGAAQRLGWGVPNLAAIAISCGVAATISTAFNAPIAGIVFAHEVVLRHFATQSFAPVTVASVTGFVLNTIILERPPLLRVDFAGVEHGYEFVLFAALGLLVALVAIAYMRLLLQAGLAIARVVPRPELRPAAAGLVLGLVALALPEVLGIGLDTLRATGVEGAFEPGRLVVLIAAKILLTALCLGAGFSGGVFSPALLVGSLMGALFWTLNAAFLHVPTSAVAVYAVAGMMAFASAVIGAPLTCILIVLELTRSYEVTIAAVVAVAFSNLLSHRVFGRSLFDRQLARDGVDLSLGRTRARLAAMPVRDLVNALTVTAAPDERPHAVVERLAEHGRREAFVVAPGDGRLLGVFTTGSGMGAATVGAVAAPPVMSFTDEVSVAEAMQRLRGFPGGEVPVIERATGRYLGAVSEGDVLAALLDVSERLWREENASL
jgi:CIC family chloride channel protein